MDAPQFDHLSRSLAALGTRRSVLRVLTGVSVLGFTLAASGGAQAARKRRAASGGVHGETFRKRKVTFCLNGKSVRRLRRKQNKLLAQGAVRGRCQACVANDSTCGTGCCGGGVCASGVSSTACGSGGGACEVCSRDQVCQNQACCVPSGGPCILQDPGACCSLTCVNGQPTPACL